MIQVINVPDEDLSLFQCSQLTVVISEWNIQLLRTVRAKGQVEKVNFFCYTVGFDFIAWKSGFPEICLSWGYHLCGKPGLVVVRILQPWFLMQQFLLLLLGTRVALPLCSSPQPRQGAASAHLAPGRRAELQGQNGNIEISPGADNGQEIITFFLTMCSVCQNSTCK